MSKHNFDIALLRNDDQREWNNLYIKLRGMLQSKSFTNQKEFVEDVFQDMIIILREKMPILNTTKDIINLAYAIYRIHLLEYNRVNLKFAKKQYVQTEDGFEEQTPDLVGCDINDVEIQENAEQLQIDLDALKRKFEAMKLKANSNNQILGVDLFNFYLAYTSEHTIPLEDLCKQFGFKNPIYLNNTNKFVQKELGLAKPIKKASTPLEETLNKKLKYQAKYRKLKKEQK
jgi:hypothetical protein